MKMSNFKKRLYVSVFDHFVGAAKKFSICPMTESEKIQPEEVEPIAKMLQVLMDAPLLYAGTKEKLTIKNAQYVTPHYDAYVAIQNGEQISSFPEFNIRSIAMTLLNPINTVSTVNSAGIKEDKVSRSWDYSEIRIPFFAMRWLKLAFEQKASRLAYLPFKVTIAKADEKLRVSLFNQIQDADYKFTELFDAAQYIFGNSIGLMSKPGEQVKFSKGITHIGITAKPMTLGNQLKLNIQQKV